MKKGLKATPALVAGFTSVFLIIFAFLVVYDSFLSVDNLLQRTCVGLSDKDNCETKLFMSRTVAICFIIVILISVMFIGHVMVKTLNGINNV